MNLTDKNKENRVIAHLALKLCENNVCKENNNIKITSTG